MRKETLQLQPISSKQFFDNWKTKMSEEVQDSHAIANYFKPYIETIPRLALGEYYWQIFNNAEPFPKILMVEGAVEILTPTNAQGLMDASIEEFFTFFHPEDLNHTMTFVTKVFEILFSLDRDKRKNNTITVYARIRNGKGDYMWNSLQYPALYFDENENFLYGMALYTNVHHLMKPDAEPMMTILDSTSKTHQVFNCYSPVNELGIQKTYPSVTEREREIIALLSQGKASKQIGDILGIAKNTVDNHRQRLLKKFEVTSSAELVVKALGT
jgi:DNA-binding CsgD family transcriptional regulator